MVHIEKVFERYGIDIIRDGGKYGNGNLPSSLSMENRMSG